MDTLLAKDMEILLAFLIGWLYACAIFLMLRRSVLRLIIGLVLLTSAANLLIFTSANLSRGAPPIIPHDEIHPVSGITDPLPQALILTAIVISFGTLAFTFILVYRAYKRLGTDDLDQMKSTDT